ncbi:hypothetical protein [Anaerovorax odorimutans]|nr:hypothetical protein [Anaerovorax odorimutans]
MNNGYVYLRLYKEEIEEGEGADFYFSISVRGFDSQNNVLLI